MHALNVLLDLILDICSTASQRDYQSANVLLEVGQPLQYASAPRGCLQLIWHMHSVAHAFSSTCMFGAECHASVGLAHVR